MDSFKINQIVDKLYNKNGLMQKYGGEVFITVLVIFIVGVIFVYLQVLNNLEPVKKNWGTERCNPFIIPLAGIINNTDKKTKSDQQYTVDNFEFCLGNIITSSFDFLLDSFKFILSGIMNMLQDILTILQGIIAWIMAIIAWVLGFLENIWGLTLQNVSSTQQLLNKVRDSFSRMVGIIVVTLYIKMMLFRMSIMWMITTPIFMIFNVICGILVKILLWCLKNQANTMLAWAQFTYCVTKTVIMDTLASAMTKEAGISVAEGVDAGVDEGIAIGEEVAGPPLAAIPIAGPALMAVDEAAGVAEATTSVAQTVTSVVAGVSAAVSATGNEITWGMTIAACGAAVTTIIYQAFAMVMTMVEITALVLSITLIILLWEFNKATLGAMNIPGQGIPGLSF